MRYSYFYSRTERTKKKIVNTFGPGGSWVSLTIEEYLEVLYTDLRQVAEDEWGGWGPLYVLYVFDSLS